MKRILNKKLELLEKDHQQLVSNSEDSKQYIATLEQQ